MASCGCRRAQASHIQGLMHFIQAYSSTPKEGGRAWSRRSHSGTRQHQSSAPRALGDGTQSGCPEQQEKSLESIFSQAAISAEQKRRARCVGPESWLEKLLEAAGECAGGEAARGDQAAGSPAGISACACRTPHRPWILFFPSPHLIKTSPRLLNTKNTLILPKF